VSVLGKFQELFDSETGCGSSKLNAGESSIQESLSLDSSALHEVVFDRYERPGNERESLTAKIQAHLSPILTANESSSELEIVKPRLCSERLSQKRAVVTRTRFLKNCST
jgi:hypothetical protein